MRKTPFCLRFSLLLLVFLLAPIFPVTVSARWDGSIFFGQLHSHSSLSHGEMPVEALFRQASELPDMDFFAVTDHSDSLDGWENAVPGEDARAVSTRWAAGRDAAAAASREDFLALFGYEMSWQETRGLGHITTFATPGFATRDQEGYRDRDTALENYYDALAAVPGAIGQFNHPGDAYGSFQGFAHWSAERDGAMCLLELGEGEALCGSYIQALEQGWHVAPTLSVRGRTAVLAEHLTEETLFDALRSRRVYATEDGDLALSFTLEGYPMGTRLAKRQVGGRVTLEAEYRDPTGCEGVTLEIITDGGVAAAGCSLNGSEGKVSFSLSSEHSYYFLRLTQSDGDRAVTAPVWIQQTEQAGIAAFTADTALPVANRETELCLSLYNEESDPLEISQITLTANGASVYSAGETLWIGPGERIDYAIPYTHPHLGQAELTVSVDAVLGGCSRRYGETLTLTFRPAELVRGIYIDAAHENAGLDGLNEFTALAESCQRQIRFVEVWEENLLGGADILVVTAPGTPFSPEFLAFAREFTAQGGSLVVCGQGDSADTALHTAYELNRLLKAIGAEITLADDTLRDPVENAGPETDVVLSGYNPDSHWYAPVLKDRVFRQTGGCTLEGGTWLVRGGKWAVSKDGDGDGGGSGTVALAWQRSSGGGDILVSGGLFLADGFLKVPKSIWKEPYANRSFAETLLGTGQEELSLTQIAEVRRGGEDRAYRIRGHITAGNSNPGTTFPHALYVQDDTGGIALAGVEEADIQTGAPVEVVGILRSGGKNPVLEVLTFTVLEEGWLRRQPITGSYRLMMDNSLNGGELVQIEGEVVSVTGEGEALSEFLLTDGQGSYATVSIDSGIRSASTGENTLARTVRPGREVRAVGILYMREDGIAALRVRDCDEVTLLADWPYADNAYADPTNPPTGDSTGRAVWTMLLTAAAITALKHRKRG